MEHLIGATSNDVLVALLVAVNSSLILAQIVMSNRQRARIERKVDAVRDEAAIHRNGHISDDAVSLGPGARRA